MKLKLIAQMRIIWQCVIRDRGRAPMQEIVYKALLITSTGLAFGPHALSVSA